MTVDLTPEDREALGEALDLAHGDQEHYLKFGDPQADYGDQWEWAATHKSELFHRLARIGEKLGFHGEKERWTNLAALLEEGRQDL